VVHVGLKNAVLWEVLCSQSYWYGDGLARFRVHSYRFKSDMQVYATKFFLHNFLIIGNLRNLFSWFMPSVYFLMYFMFFFLLYFAAYSV